MATLGTGYNPNAAKLQPAYGSQEQLAATNDQKPAGFIAHILGDVVASNTSRALKSVITTWAIYIGVGVAAATALTILIAMHILCPPSAIAAWAFGLALGVMCYGLFLGLPLYDASQKAIEEAKKKDFQQFQQQAEIVPTYS